MNQPAANPATDYTGTAKFLHWLMAGMWIAAWILGIIAVYWRDEFNPDHSITVLHKTIASALLFLIVVRVAWRWTHPAPPLPASMSPAMQRGAVIGHLALYVLALIALPVSGWAWSSVADKPISVLGLFQLPHILPTNPEAYDLVKWIHKTLAWLTGALVGGHLLLALKHHVIDRDHVLKGMLPRKRG